MNTGKKCGKKIASAFFIFTVFMISVYADGKNEELTTWTKIVEKMEVHLNNAYDLYTQGKAKEAYDEVNVAYFRFYESKGMEKITMQEKPPLKTLFMSIDGMCDPIKITNW